MAYKATAIGTSTGSPTVKSAVARQAHTSNLYKSDDYFDDSSDSMSTKSTFGNKWPHQRSIHQKSRKYGAKNDMYTPHYGDASQFGFQRSEQTRPESAASMSRFDRAYPHRNISNNYNNGLSTARIEEPDASVGQSEVKDLRQQLNEARSKIAVMDQELAQNRITQQSIGQVLDSPQKSVLSAKNIQALNKFSTEGPLAAASQPHGATTAGPVNAWSDDSRFPSLAAMQPGRQGPTAGATPWNQPASAPWTKTDFGPVGAPVRTHKSERQLRQTYQDGNSAGDYDRLNTAVPRGRGYGDPSWQPNGGVSLSNPKNLSSVLSPTAMEFSSDTMGAMSSYGHSLGHLAHDGMNPRAGSYVYAAEPMNYRRMLDKNVVCNWKMVVDKIVCNNDQQASIFLQQKLKASAPDQKSEIIDAIIAQAYPLMINRFGNFLIQRCFEHGNEDQIIEIARAIRGNTLNLSMDAFGCHVVQKAFDIVPEEYKAVMVHELLRRIPDTVIHRYACHVWQKLFELRWNESPPQIMKYVNEALSGMWHEVALGETGSLVVQNIFENCLDDDKRPCIDEVLDHIDVIARGQFGNWCIQHICEHGAPIDKSHAIEHVLRRAIDYSTDQFASKVIEKCLKVGGRDFIDRYLERVCEARADRPRLALVDIAGDQYGNYLIQWILNNASPEDKDTVSQNIRKHMVSLRGSKFGSRVAMLCNANSNVTRMPGAGRGYPSVLPPQVAYNPVMFGRPPPGAY